jgi:hypothetical protein
MVHVLCRSVSAGCQPRCCAPAVRFGAAVAAEGTVEQVLGLQPHNTLQLAVTVASVQQVRTRLVEAADARDIEQPYNTLQVTHAYTWGREYTRLACACSMRLICAARLMVQVACSPNMRLLSSCS